MPVQHEAHEILSINHRPRAVSLRAGGGTISFPKVFAYRAPTVLASRAPCAATIASAEDSRCASTV